ncbi:hypothetical protein NFI96_033164, partial [Prochilodus magdalenae]
MTYGGHHCSLIVHSCGCWWSLLLSNVTVAHSCHFTAALLTHVTMLCSSYWLPVAARIRFKPLILAYKARNEPVLPSMPMVILQSVPQALRASFTAWLDLPSFVSKVVRCPGIQM